MGAGGEMVAFLEISCFRLGLGLGYGVAFVYWLS